MVICQLQSKHVRPKIGSMKGSDTALEIIE
jgi:hypothetical protein